MALENMQAFGSKQAAGEGNSAWEHRSKMTQCAMTQ